MNWGLTSNQRAAHAAENEAGIQNVQNYEFRAGVPQRAPPHPPRCCIELHEQELRMKSDCEPVLMKKIFIVCTRSELSFTLFCSAVI